MQGLTLTRLTLSHFRSWRHGTVETDGRPVAMHGPNGAGKTNLLEAVSLFSPGRGLRRARAEDLSRRPEALGWKLTGRLDTLGQGHEVTMGAEAGSSRALRIDDKAAPQVALGRIARVLWLVPAMDRLWIEGAEGRRRFLDRMTLSFMPGHADAALAYEKAMRERNRLLKDMVRDAHWYTALETQMSEAGAQLTANRMHALDLITQAQAGAETAFPAADLALTHPDGPLPDGADALRAAWRDGRGRDMAAGRTLLGPHRADMEAHWPAKGIAARDASTGEQKALLVSLILSNARGLARDFGAPPILLLDEVAAHLDATRRAALYDEVCALGAQAWMTGTGPELFEELGSRAHHIEITEQGGESGLLERTP
ncbi:DNA replication/repair protein RecF [Pseudooceanicola aestuarii]|uniref:DNA replication/repair protein RecF n=1 Tax=Pseudooceanicola aestuarii TaxID=2697319 RepID=UPI0013D0C4D2|nr:DNA replication/repair protein RecF [Pseudooceanicola aestuarii]